MTDPQQRASSEIGAKDDIEMRLGANLVHLPIVRAVAVNIAMRADFDVDAISDLELAVDEACSSLITHAVAGSVLSCRFTIGADDIMFTATITSTEDVTPSESTFGWRVLTTLADDVASWADQVDDSLHQVHIEFVKRRPVVTR
ncbi:MAG: ATP-binding protein [Actinophytocola sp.]|nr:ATP-binding protein [Actinophytocola sp.]